MTDKPKDFRDYLDFVKRRKRHILLPMVAIFLLSIGVALLIPAVYRSRATILIEGQEIPRDLVRSTVTGYADQRIELIKQRVMSRSSLLQIIEEYGLYQQFRQDKTTEDLLVKIADDINVEVISAEIKDQRTGRQTDATIAFTLSFDENHPALAQRVTNELTSLFLAENLRIREKSAKETTSFLRQESEKLSSRIEEIEKNIALFKEENSGSLPELVQFNMQLLEQANRDLMDADRQIRSLEERQIYLGGQLLSINKDLPIGMSGTERVLDPTERLKVLRSQWITLSALQSTEHPDLKKLRREILALEKVVGETSEGDALRKKLSEEKKRLQFLQEQFGREHPDVLRAKKIIVALQQEMIQAEGQQESTLGKTPQNPAYIAIQTQLASTNNDLLALKNTKETIKGLRLKYSGQIENSPMVEREYTKLNRDHDNLTLKYREIRSKLLEAEVSEGLEKERKGERFSLIEPASLPEKPVKPNRPAIIFLGFVFSLAAGFGFGAISESLDHTIYSSSNLEQITGISPIGFIPKILNTEDRNLLIHKRRSFAVGSAGVVILILIVVHYLLIPLDVIFFSALEK